MMPPSQSSGSTAGGPAAGGHSFPLAATGSGPGINPGAGFPHPMLGLGGVGGGSGGSGGSTGNGGTGAGLGTGHPGLVPHHSAPMQPHQLVLPHGHLSPVLISGQPPGAPPSSMHPLALHPAVGGHPGALGTSMAAPSLVSMAGSSPPQGPDPGKPMLPRHSGHGPGHMAYGRPFPPGMSAPVGSDAGTGRPSTMPGGPEDVPSAGVGTVSSGALASAPATTDRLEQMKADVRRYVVELLSVETRDSALRHLMHYRKDLPDLALTLWFSYGVTAVLLHEIIAIYPFLTSSAGVTTGPRALRKDMSDRVCSSLALLQSVATHSVTRIPFLNARISIFVYPFLFTTCPSEPFAMLRLSSIGVIGALVRHDNSDVIQFLLHSDIMPHCVRIMENDAFISKLVAIYVILKILSDPKGLERIVAKRDYLQSVIRGLGQMAVEVENGFRELATTPSGPASPHGVGPGGLPSSPAAAAAAAAAAVASASPLAPATNKSPTNLLRMFKNLLRCYHCLARHPSSRLFLGLEPLPRAIATPSEESTPLVVAPVFDPLGRLPAAFYHRPGSTGALPGAGVGALRPASESPEGASVPPPVSMADGGNASPPGAGGGPMPTGSGPSPASALPPDAGVGAGGSGPGPGPGPGQPAWFTSLVRQMPYTMGNPDVLTDTNVQQHLAQLHAELVSPEQPAGSSVSAGGAAAPPVGHHPLPGGLANGAGSPGPLGASDPAIAAAASVPRHGDQTPGHGGSLADAALGVMPGGFHAPAGGRPGGGSF
ncbi:hypothetical protein H696_02926 [Fonticula alba]|uniref:Cell differentiation protein rcd1 n=1 Tax=Fonticula alba TaxID=691883 RepID=A0A058Z912_FONAL|nr:hypothetical protein H696_02926 [Fonticula alba]KCV70581.1 hypothetical protein H696_02926 [Fonticula alba]|eukprot:XP_009495097.1 hypothetical protein H696_02926 [Fonticula alba]